MPIIYTVTQTIQSTRIDAGEPVEVNYYNGPDRANAITAAAQATDVYDPEWVILRGVRIDVTYPEAEPTVEPEVSGNEVLGASTSTVRYFVPRPEAGALRRYGGRITSYAPLDESLYDRDEVGPVFTVRVEHYSGVIHAFADEIKEEQA